MPLPTDRCVVVIMFSGLSVHECMLSCVSVHPDVHLLARCLTNQWTEFDQSLVDDVVDLTDDELIGS